MRSPASVAHSWRFPGAGRKARGVACVWSPSSIRNRASASRPVNEARRMISERLRNPLSLFDVRDKVVIITGSSGSFGHACAVALGALGAKLLLASGSREELSTVIEDVRGAGGNVESIVRRPDSLEDAEAILQAALDAYGRADRLVVASGTNKAGFIEKQSYEEWQRVMDANVRGPWLMAEGVGSYWIREGIKGKVVLMSSTRGRHGNFSGYTAYCSSNAATDGLTRLLATEP